MNNDFNNKTNLDFNSFKSQNNSNNNLEDNQLNFNLNNSKLVDIRIVLTNLDYIEPISKAVSNFDLSNFNVNISSIIPSNNLEIVKNNIIGADLVLIAASSDEEGKTIYDKFKKVLKKDYNFIAYLKLPSLEEYADYDYDEFNEENIFEDEIANSIIRSGLYSISNLSSINTSKKLYYQIKNEYDNNRVKYDKILKENEVLINDLKNIREKNEKYLEEVKILQKDLDLIKSDYSDLKSKFESIHTKNSLEVFSLLELWQDLFNESLSEEIYRFILISTDNFRPKNLIIGQGAICAESREDALDWLKIIKTAFIVSDTNKKDLDFNNFNSNFKFDTDEYSLNNNSNLNSNIYSNIDSIHSNVRSNDFNNENASFDFNSNLNSTRGSKINSNNSYNDLSSESQEIDNQFFNAFSNLNAESNLDNRVNSSYSNLNNEKVSFDSNLNNKEILFDSNLNNEENSFNSNYDDGFIYNERFEGKTGKNEENEVDADFKNINFDEDFNLDKESSNNDEDSDEINDEINVFNLSKSLKSIDDEDNDYDFEDEELEESDEEIYSDFSNIWG